MSKEVFHFDDLTVRDAAWTLLSPAGMSEGVVATDKPKRQRAKKADSATIKGPGVAQAGNWVVCTYCGNTANKALVPASVVRGAAFDTFPCGLAWINEHAPDAATAAAAREAYSKLYSQPPGLAVAAPPTKDLLQFGGDLTIEQWLPNYALWQQLTHNMGVTAAEIPGMRNKKAKPAAGGVITFDVGMYVIPAKGAPKVVNAVDSAAKKTGDLTPVGAQRKLNKWAAANEGYGVHHFDTDKFSVSGCIHATGDAALLNNTATQLCGGNIYGPAIALFTRKVSLKV